MEYPYVYGGGTAGPCYQDGDAEITDFLEETVASCGLNKEVCLADHWLIT